MREFEYGFEEEFSKINAEYRAEIKAWQDSLSPDLPEAFRSMPIVPETMEQMKERRERKAWRLIISALDEFRGQESMTFNAFARLTALTGRIFGPRSLWILDKYGALDPAAYAESVPYAWSMAEFPMLSMEKRDWIRLWRKAGFVNDKPRPTEPIQVWRGARAQWKKGMSWTDNEERARWFAQARSKARLYTATVEPERLLAHLGESARGEDEWVVDTTGLVVTEVT